MIWRARGPGNMPSRAAAFFTSSLDSRTADTSMLSCCRIGNSFSAPISRKRTQGSPACFTPASLRRRSAVCGLILPSSAFNAPAMPPGKRRPMRSTSSANSDTTADSVSRSTVRIWPIALVRCDCSSSGRSSSGMSAPSFSSRRTTTAALARRLNWTGAPPPDMGSEGMGEERISSFTRRPQHTGTKVPCVVASIGEQSLKSGAHKA